MTQGTLIPVGGELHSTATGNILASATAIYDYTSLKTLRLMNQDILDALGNLTWYEGE